MGGEGAELSSCGFSGVHPSRDAWLAWERYKGHAVTLQFLAHEILCRVMAQLAGLMGRWNLVCVLISEVLVPSLQMDKDAIILTPASDSVTFKALILFPYDQCLLMPLRYIP